MATVADFIACQRGPVRPQYRICAAALFAVAGLGCRPSEPEPGDKPPPPAVEQQAAPAAAHPQPTTDVAGRPAVADEDLEFMKRTLIVGAFELEAAELAREKGGHPTVIMYAEAAIRDHTQLVIALDALATTKGLKLVDGRDVRHAGWLRDLSAQASGHAFDARYGTLVQRSHTEAIALFRHAATRSRDPDVRDFAASALQLLTPHGEAIGLLGADGVASARIATVA